MSGPGPFDDAYLGLHRMIKNTVLLKDMAEWMSEHADDHFTFTRGERQRMEDFVARYHEINPEAKEGAVT